MTEQFSLVLVSSRGCEGNPLDGPVSTSIRGTVLCFMKEFTKISITHMLH